MAQVLEAVQEREVEPVSEVVQEWALQHRQQLRLHPLQQEKLLPE